MSQRIFESVEKQMNAAKLTIARMNLGPAVKRAPMSNATFTEYQGAMMYQSSGVHIRFNGRTYIAEEVTPDESVAIQYQLAPLECLHTTILVHPEDPKSETHTIKVIICEIGEKVGYSKDPHKLDNPGAVGVIYINQTVEALSTYFLIDPKNDPEAFEQLITISR